ncbi:cell division suppressor protein YneA [Bacillus solimangrovi]|nr:LysM peptidoglycan-binding domain-containing protein [Bacillus solimangrovi]
MTKLDYSYLIPFLIMSVISFFVIVGQLQPINTDEYLKVAVQEGDTLWGLSARYKDFHELSSSSFISWVEKENNIFDNHIFPGQEIILPVEIATMQVVMNE